MSPEASEPAAIAKSCPAGQFFTSNLECAYPSTPIETAPTVAVQPAAASCEKIVAPIFILAFLCFALMVVCVIVVQRYNNARKAFDEARKQYDDLRADLVTLGKTNRAG